MVTVIPKTLHTLLHTIVDYAGLFPPAGLAMDAAVENYAAYRRDPNAWMLGRFVVPVARLEEMTAAMRAAGVVDPVHHWRLSALAGADLAADMERIASFNAAAEGAMIDAVEVKASTVAGVAKIAETVPPGIRGYVEIPVADDPRELIGEMARLKLRAKIRTGGVTPEAFPPVDDVVRFIRHCYATGAGFKATAGLHHPLRAEHALTYEAAAPRGVMHGFMNVFLTAALHYNGLTIADAREVMHMTSLDGVEFTDEEIAWGEYRLSRDEVTTIRRRFAISFGSCSFREPVDDLLKAGLIV